jgi:hypothetical protein
VVPPDKKVDQAHMRELAWPIILKSAVLGSKFVYKSLITHLFLPAYRRDLSLPPRPIAVG